VSEAGKAISSLSSNVLMTPTRLPGTPRRRLDVPGGFLALLSQI
jgi:hypothetical protein